MRAVNLIPPEERRGESAPTRTGGLAYVVVVALGLILAAVTGTVLFNKKVDDKKAEAVAVEARAAETQARAQSLSAFATFQQIHDARISTVDSLARSRFDWERVMRELAIVLPDHIWLTNLTGTVAPGVEIEKDASISLRDGIEGPAIELIGCGRSQRDVARLIAALHDIDGVTRVTAAESRKPENTVSQETSTQGTEVGANDECRTRNTIPKFSLVAAFDAVPAPPGAGAAPPVAPAPAPTDGSTTTSDAGTAQTEEQAGVEAAEQDVDQATGLAGG